MNHQVNTMHLAEVGADFIADGYVETGKTLKQAAELIDQLSKDNACLEIQIESLKQDCRIFRNMWKRRASQEVSK